MEASASSPESQTPADENHTINPETTETTENVLYATNISKIAAGADETKGDEKTKDEVVYESEKMNCFLKVNSKAFSTPNPITAATIDVPHDDSFTFLIHFFWYDGKYAEIRVDVHAFKATREKVASIVVKGPAVNIFDFIEIRAQENVMEHLAGFCDSQQLATHIRSIPQTACVVSINAYKAYFDIDRLQHAQLRFHNTELYYRLGDLEKAILEGNRNRKVVLEFTFGQVIAKKFLGTEGPPLEKILGQVIKRDRSTFEPGTGHPLAWAFVKSPQAHQLHHSNCPRVDVDGDMPELPPNLPASTRYHDSEEQLVAHITSSVVEALRESGISETRSRLEFDAFAIALPHLNMDRRFVLAVSPGVQDEYLPNEGERCVVSISGIKRRPRKLPQPPEGETSQHISDSSQPGYGARDPVVEELVEIFLTGVEDAEIEEYKEQYLKRKLGKYFTDDSAMQDPPLATLCFQHEEHRVARQIRVEKYVKDKFEAGTIALEGADEPINTASTNMPLWDAGRWKAERIPHQFETVSSMETKFFLVTIPLEPKDEIPEGQERLPIDVKVPMMAVGNDETDLQGCFKRYIAQQENALKVTFFTTPSDKTLAAESSAINDLHYPRSAQPPPSEWSQMVHRWLLDFPELTDNLSSNVFEKYPHMTNILKEDTIDKVPMYLRDIWNELDGDQQAVYANLPNNILALKFVAGVPGSGKTKLITFINLMLRFGDQNVDQPYKTLYLVSHNKGVDDFAQKMANAYAAMGKDTSQVVRMYNFETEIDDWNLQRASEKTDDPFDKEQAQRSIVSVTDKFMAHHELSKLALELHDSRRSSHSPRLKQLSLHTAAFLYYQKNKSAWPLITEILEEFNTSGSLENSQKSVLSTEVARLYKEYLEQFTGVIAATPVAINHAKFRSAVGQNVDMIFVDEAGRMSELGLLIPIARFTPNLFMVVGDPRQLPVFTTMVSNALVDPYKLQHRKSTLHRATEAGVVKSYLTVNHRSLSHLSALPSRLFYSRQMVSSREAENLKHPSIVQHRKFLQRLHPDMSESRNRLLIELPSSQTGNLGKSTYNTDHVQYVMKILLEYLEIPGLTGVGPEASRPSKVLILPFYKAQVLQYEKALDKSIKERTLTPDQLARVEVRTLDSSQGSERDFVIVDMVQTTQPGFCADQRRLAVALTRSKQAEIILMNHGMHDLSYKRKAKDPDMDYFKLREIYQALFNEDCRLTISTQDYRGTDDICKNCGEKGHSTHECLQPLKCQNCSATDHPLALCRRPMKKKCHSCGLLGHIKEDCSNVDSSLGAPPPADQVNDCFLCGQTGHFKKDCPDKEKYMTCRKCGEMGHKAADCPNKKPKCSICREIGHDNQSCPKTVARTFQHKMDDGRTEEISIPSEHFDSRLRVKLEDISGVRPRPLDEFQREMMKLQGFPYEDTGPSYQSHEDPASSGQSQWNAPASGQSQWDAPASGQSQWDAPASGQSHEDPASFGQSQWNAPASGQSQWDAPAPGQSQWDAPASGQSQWNAPASGQSHEDPASSSHEDVVHPDEEPNPDSGGL
ncbi:hypothetical protein NKR23_g4018 [Pleurostoma richardsiae]|uniref:CCHC-type domain-containing protein n=1 Tax=Pleurostoma richardsiae TaxID=41990 RepID=A0AA38S3K1_9PEZI|nr:hypothetical protein NKR23_g4018 [Pleurostoma richardsiae]